MTSRMTATDELRRLLDERGAEWIGTSFSTPTKGHPTNTSLGEEHHEATFIEYDDGNVLRLFDLTPEQAVEATLGRGTCTVVSKLLIEGEYVPSSYYEFEMECGEGFKWDESEPPRYCPNCGRRCVG